MDYILEWVNSDVQHILKSSQGPASRSVLLIVYRYIYIHSFALCVSVHFYAKSIPYLIYKWL